MLGCHFIFPDEVMEDTENNNSPLNNQQTSTGRSAKSGQEFE